MCSQALQLECAWYCCPNRSKDLTFVLWYWCGTRHLMRSSIKRHSACSVTFMGFISITQSGKVPVINGGETRKYWRRTMCAFYCGCGLLCLDAGLPAQLRMPVGGWVMDKVFCLVQIKQKWATAGARQNCSQWRCSQELKRVSRMTMTSGIVLPGPCLSVEVRIQPEPWLRDLCVISAM